MKGAFARVPPPATEAPLLDLARGWYVVSTSRRLGSAPKPVVLAGCELVAWRAEDGTPVVMGRYCPHQGASLALGTVRQGTLECPFHHWRFDSRGACVLAPGTRRLPPGTPNAGALPTYEGLGFVWAWIGPISPNYPPPEFPEPTSMRRTHRAYPFAFHTNAPARRILENAFDTAHFMIVHSLPAGRPLHLAWTEPESPASIGARITASDLRLGLLDRLVTVDELVLTVTSTPSYQTLGFEIDGREVARELLALTPTRAGATDMRGWVLLPRTRDFVGSALGHWAYRLQHWQGTREDLRIYRHAQSTDGSVNEPNDEGVLKFRKFYRSWLYGWDDANG